MFMELYEKEKEKDEDLKENLDMAADIMRDKPFVEVTVDFYESIIKSDEDRQRIEEILKEYRERMYLFRDTPRQISVFQMERLMKMEKNESRAKFYKYLFVTQVHSERVKMKKPKEPENFGEDDSVSGQFFDKSNRPIYRTFRNCPFLSLRHSKLDSVHDYKKKNAALFGSKLVFDFSYNDLMDWREKTAAAGHLQAAYFKNLKSKDPFDLYFCNLDPESEMSGFLRRSFPNLDDPKIMISLEARSYLDIFPREKLVYMSPDAEEPYVYDPDDIPIIGVLVDLQEQKHLSYDKSTLENIRKARMPLTECFEWNVESARILPLSQVTGILCDVKSNNGNWSEAIVKNSVKKRLKSPLKMAQEAEHKLRLEFERKSKELTIDYLYYNYNIKLT